MLFQQGEYLPAGLAKEDEVLQYYLKNVNPDPQWAEDPVAIDPKDKDTPGKRICYKIDYLTSLCKTTGFYVILSLFD